MSVGNSKASIAKSLLGWLYFYLGSASIAVASDPNQATGIPPKATQSLKPMTDIHDIKPALAFGAHWPWWLWLLIVLALVSVCALIWWFRRRSSANQGIAAPPAWPPEVEAFQQLDALAADGQGDPKRFYFSLSAVLRYYVERRFGFPAAEMTTEELLPRIQHLPMADALAKAFKRFCLSSDPIKFADAPADPARMGQDITFARQFVEETTAAIEPTTPGAPDKPASIAMDNNP